MKTIAYIRASTMTQDVKNQRHEILEFAHRERIQELLSLGVPQSRIIESHLGYGTTKSLSYYIRTREIHKQVEIP